MDMMIHPQTEREAQRVQANREELVERIARAIREDGPAQPLKGFTCTVPPCLWSRFTAWSSHPYA